MSNGFLSQEEINALLNGEGSQEEEEKKEATDTELPQLPDLTDLEKDLLGGSRKYIYGLSLHSAFNYNKPTG